MNIIYSVIILHFVFDWVLQPRDIAKKKGFSEEGVEAVLMHMLINILPFSFVVGGILLIYTPATYSTVLGIMAINGVSHFLIDVFLPKGKTESQMIDYTALDQILHLIIILSLIQDYCIAG